MSQYRKILLIADPALNRTPAFQRAVQLATSTGAELQICLFDYSSAIAAVGVISSKAGDIAKWGFVERRERWLSEQADQLRANGLRVDTEMVWGKPVHECIIEKVLRSAPDLVLKDIHLEPLLKSVLFTPLDWQLLRLCPVPLLMVNGAAHKLPRRVIAAVDTAHPMSATDDVNDRIVNAALQLAIQCDATLHLVQTFEDLIPMVPGEVITPGAYEEVYEQMRKIHRYGFDEFAARHSVPTERKHFLYGPTSVALVQFANESKTDVLVLGTTHRTGLDRIVIGSTAETILGDLRCDVLAVKPAGFMTDLARHFDFDKLHRKAEQPAKPAEFTMG